LGVGFLLKRNTMKSSELIFHERPDLFRPWLIVGYKGWIDAGYVSSGSVTFLRRKLGAKRFAEIQSDGFYEFRELRPDVVVEGGVLRQVEFPKNEFFYWRNSPLHSDLILFIGHEPHLRWKAFTDLFLELTGELGVERVVIIGGLYDQVAHTIPRSVSVVASNQRLLDKLLDHGVDVIDYAGPGGQVSFLHQSAERRGIDSCMLWGRVPYYLQMRSPTDTLAVLHLLASLVPFEVDLSSLQEDVVLADEQIRRAIEQKPELRSYIKQLESMQGRKTEATAEPSDQVVIKAVITQDDKEDNRRD
jgi:proteasome assembly chaperone (PAC2) family protein